MRISTSLIRWFETLRVPQGTHSGQRLRALPWQRRFLRMFDEPGDLALSIARRNGKTVTGAALISATLDTEGPLFQPGADNVIAASSFQQGQLLFRMLRRLMADRLADRATWRVLDSTNRASIEHRPTGARVAVAGNNPARAHGLAVGIGLLDELAQWDKRKRDKMLNILRTGCGTIPGARLVSIGTRPADQDHPFAAMLAGPRGLVFAADDDADPMDPATWEAGNPSMKEPEFSTLREQIAREAAEAKRDPLMLAAFKALRLNMGTSEALRSVLIEAATWRRIETTEAPARRGPYALGVDLSGGAAMSACSGYWWRSGNLESFAGFPSKPSISARGLADGVGELYVRMRDEGSLIECGHRVPDLGRLLMEALRRWGKPAVIVADHYKLRDFRQALETSGFPAVPLVKRGMGWVQGSEDVRLFRSACLRGDVTPQRSLLLRAAFKEARVMADQSGNLKFAKTTQGGRRELARDDAAASSVLAVAEGTRQKGKDAMRRPRKWAIVG